MKQWMVVPFLLVILTGKVLAESSVTPQSGVYAVASIEAVEANPMIDKLLPDIEERMERAWIRFDRESRGAEIYMEGQEEPLLYEFDFESLLATSPDNPTAELQLESPEQFVVIHGEPFEVAFTFQQIDEDGPEFAALQSSREAWLEGKQTVIDEEQERSLTELFDVEPLSPNMSDPVDWDLSYIFDMPVDWDVVDITLSNTDAIASEGLLFSNGFGVPGLVVGQLLTDADTFRQSVILTDYARETIDLESPERSLTIFMDNEGNLGFLGFVLGSQGETSVWLVEPNDFLEPRDIQTLIAMYYTIRVRDAEEGSLSYVDPATWPHYRLTEDSEQKLRNRIEEMHTLEEMLSLMGGQVRVALFDDDRRREHLDFSLTLVDEEPESLSPMSPLLSLGNPGEGKVRLWEDGLEVQCEASLSLPIFSREREELAYLRIAEYVGHYSYQGPDYSQYERCIAAWSALQGFRETLESELSTDLSVLASALAGAESAYLRDGYLVVAREVGDDLLRGVLSREGETIIPAQYKRIDIHSDWIMAEDAQGKWVFSDTGETLLPMPLMSFFPAEGLEGRYIALYKNEKEEVRYGLFDMDHKDMVVPFELGDLSFDEEKEVLLAEYPDGSEAVLSPDGENIGERFASIHPLSGTSNYLVKDAEAGLWYFADERLEKQSEPFASATLHRRARLVFVRFPEAEHEKNDLSPAYFNYDGNRVTSPDMTPAYAPSEDGFITVWTEKRPFLGILGAPEKRWGLIDRTGEVVIPLEYDQLHQEREGVVPVRRDDAFAVFSEDGSQLTDFEWGNLSLSFSGGLMARHPLLNEWQLIDHQGRLRNQDVFTERPVHVAARHHESGEITDMFVALRDRKFGMLSSEGDIVVPFVFVSVDTRFNEPVFTNSEGRDKRYPYDFRE